MWLIRAHYIPPSNFVSRVFETPHQLLEVGVCLLQATDAIEHRHVNVVNLLVVGSEVRRGAPKEEVPLVDVDIVIASEDAGRVEERVQKLIFFEQASADAEVESTSYVLNQNLESLFKLF